MTPYYQDDAVTIYHADCRDVMGGLGYDCVLADPPYGIGYVETRPFRSFVGRPIVGDDGPFDPAHLLSVPAILWGANYYADRLPISGGWLTWVKRDNEQAGVKPTTMADCELAWSNCVKGARWFRHLWTGPFRDSERDLRVHPTQKPVALMVWCIGYLPGGIILDPYMGSGPVLRAAKDLGRKAIGIEIEERYCEIAARRMQQEVLAL